MGLHAGETEQFGGLGLRVRHDLAEHSTFEVHCTSHPVEEARCSSSHECSIRPVWQLLQQRIDDVLEGVHLSDLLVPESQVRARVGLPVLTV